MHKYQTLSQQDLKKKIVKSLARIYKYISLSNVHKIFCLPNFQTQPRNDIGGPYIAVHLRRGDHLHVRGRELPSIGEAAKHVRELLQKMFLDTVFVATNGTKQGARYQLRT